MESISILSGMNILSEISTLLENIYENPLDLFTGEKKYSIREIFIREYNTHRIHACFPNDVDLTKLTTLLLEHGAKRGNISTIEISMNNNYVNIFIGAKI